MFFCSDTTKSYHIIRRNGHVHEGFDLSFHRIHPHGIDKPKKVQPVLQSIPVEARTLSHEPHLSVPWGSICSSGPLFPSSYMTAECLNQNLVADLSVMDQSRTSLDVSLKDIEHPVPGGLRCSACFQKEFFPIRCRCHTDHVP